MIIRRLALFFALLFGFAMTQLPEFVAQYEQRLGGAIDELAAIVTRFDSDSAQQSLTQSGGIDRLRANGDAFVRERGDQMQDDVVRLARLRETQTAFRSDGPVSRLATFASHYDSRVARGAYDDFKPAVPTTAEAFVLGLSRLSFRRRDRASDRPSGSSRAGAQTAITPLAVRVIDTEKQQPKSISTTRLDLNRKSTRLCQRCVARVAAVACS